MHPAVGPSSLPQLCPSPAPERAALTEADSGGQDQVGPASPCNHDGGFGELAGWASHGPLTICECTLTHPPGTPCSWRARPASSPPPDREKVERRCVISHRQAATRLPSDPGEAMNQDTRLLPTGVNHRPKVQDSLRPRLPAQVSDANALQTSQGRAGRSPGPTWNPRPVCKTLTTSLLSFFLVAETASQGGQKASIYTACSLSGSPYPISPRHLCPLTLITSDLGTRGSAPPQWCGVRTTIPTSQRKPRPRQTGDLTCHDTTPEAAPGLKLAVRLSPF